MREEKKKLQRTYTHAKGAYEERKRELVGVDEHKRKLVRE
jgi:hypothetical protein